MIDLNSVFEKIEAGSLESERSLICDLITSCKNNSTINTSSPLSRQIHPLGFLCLKWKIDDRRSVRIHIWDKKFNCTQSPNWPIHDHVFSFKSYVLLGCIQNKTYKEGDSDRNAWNIFNVIYENEASIMRWNGNKKSFSFGEVSIQERNSAYNVDAGVFHRSILRSEYAITILATRQDDRVHRLPRVVGNRFTGDISFDRSTSHKPNVEELLDQAVGALKLNSAIKHFKNFASSSH